MSKHSIRYTNEQQKAISTIDKNLQVIACAGSGKTQVLSQRIVTILSEKKEVEPKNIIAFTYTEKAAAELKTRVLRMVKEQIGNVQGLSEMYVGTIHSWCLQALQDNVYEFQKYSILDAIKQKLFVDKYYNEIGMVNVGMSRYKETDRFLTAISVLREADVSDSLPEEWKEALELYSAKLNSHSYFDFTSIMTETINQLKNNPDFSAAILSNLKYLIVDEYQDVNPIQEQLIVELSKTGSNVCVVGDDDQTIYQWRGGDVQYIQKFKDRYPNVEYIKLEDNFRSSEGVIDTAYKSISNNTFRLPKVMNATGHQQFEFGNIIYNQYDDEEDEIEFVIDTIKKLRGKSFFDAKGKEPRGLDYSDFSILLRKWKKAENFMHALTDEGIPFIVGGVNELFERPEIKAARAIYQYLTNEIEDDSLKLYWESASENLKDEDLDFAIAHLDKQKPKPKGYFSSFNLQQIFWDFIQNAKLHEEAFNDEEHPGLVGNEINEVVFYNLGMFSQIINDYESIHYKDKPIYKLNGFLRFLQYSADGYYPEGWLNASYQTPNAVQIMTIFQSKGLEYPVVFIPGLNKNYLPSMKPTGNRAVTAKLIQSLPVKNVERFLSAEEDERRLMYVALTRSQKYLYLTRAKESKLYQKESIFAKEVSNSDYVISDPNPDYSNIENLPPKAKIEKPAMALNFSVLKEFFDCPYRFKLISMYGFVQPISETVGYGNSVHNVLMELHRKHLSGTDVSKENIVDIVDTHTHMPHASDSVFERTKERVHTVTSEYLKENIKDFDNIEYAEKEIQIDLGEGILINGRMDLIKKKELGGKEITTIVDFKSQKEAQRQDVTMDQLALYALGYREISGKQADILQIFNLDEDGHSKQQQRLDNTKLDDIKTKILHSADEIRNNNLSKSCDASACSKCYYKALCSGNKK
ncbi:ATP-dependent helicase [Saccharicrinis sp. GN24d3]|uniref:ATP-dependent helicase n=1 Tax=Saccharicrinis sp. GN24d3 TaxID=3458416 RepID=UPI0040367AFD